MRTERILMILFCFSSLIVVVLLSFKIVLALTAFTASQQQTINFLTDDADLSSPYTDKEKAHLEDVKKVMTLMDYLFYATLLISTLIITSFRQQKEKTLLFLKWSGITIVASVVVMILFLLFDFSAVFTLFHQLFFPQGNWLFPVDSLLIQTFPLEFFENISIKIFGLSFGIGLIMMNVQRILKLL